jgi:sensor histidine kinase regulating citrate/malate metabolism
VSKRQTLIVVSGLVLTAIVLLLSSFQARLIFSILVLVTALGLLARAFLSSTKQTSSIDTRDINATEPPEIFAVAQLFEATMGGMREGLLVVNRDMRVVAANPAARKLFNPTLPKLESQRLTELTRNPAIYSAFLDALQGEERAAVRGRGQHGESNSVLRIIAGISASGVR